LSQTELGGYSILPSFAIGTALAVEYARASRVAKLPKIPFTGEARK